MTQAPIVFSLRFFLLLMSPFLSLMTSTRTLVTMTTRPPWLEQSEPKRDNGIHDRVETHCILPWSGQLRARGGVLQSSIQREGRHEGAHVLKTVIGSLRVTCIDGADYRNAQSFAKQKYGHRDTSGQCLSADVTPLCKV
jgi:hypothetical protein